MTTKDVFLAIAPSVLSREGMTPEGIVAYCREVREKLFEEELEKEREIKNKLFFADLSVRSQNVLQNLGINTIMQLKEWIVTGDLERIRNVGKATMREIRSKLQEASNREAEGDHENTGEGD
jgi:DNA-directed RNA polymerase alpha subunit